MTDTVRYTLPKEERISSKLQIERLFGGGESHSMTAFPIRMVYMIADDLENEPATKILVSVPKKYFKRAVKRNRVKRQLRESYRKNKYIALDKMQTESGKTLLMAFVWMEDRLHNSEYVEKRVKNLLTRMAERI